VRDEAILADAYKHDMLRGRAGLDYAVELRLGGIDDDPAEDQFAIWIVQRDERYGATLYPTCFRVVPWPTAPGTRCDASYLSGARVTSQHASSSKNAATNPC